MLPVDHPAVARARSTPAKTVGVPRGALPSRARGDGSGPTRVPRRWHQPREAALGRQRWTAHSPQFAPVIEPTLKTGTAAIVVAALAWLSS